jgi:hypothetical protein
LALTDLETMTQAEGEGWALAHVHRLLHLIEQIGAELIYDAPALTVAVYLHDWGAFPRYRRPDVEHALRSRQVAEADILPRMALAATQLTIILDAIAYHDYRDPRPAPSTEALLLREADFLDLAVSSAWRASSPGDLRTWRRPIGDSCAAVRRCAIASPCLVRRRSPPCGWRAWRSARRGEEESNGHL